MIDGKFVVHVVDPDQAIADGLETLLSTYDFEVRSYPDAESFLQSWQPRRATHCCLLAEADLPGLSGPALLQELRRRQIDIPVLLLIGTSPPGMIEAARHASHVGIVQKPCVNDALIEQILRISQEA